MGIDDRIVYNITVRDGQVNIANDNANISATNTVGSIDIQELNRLIDTVRTEASKSKLTNDDMEIVDNGLDVIGEESQSYSPRKKFIKTAITGIKTVKGTAEFLAAVAALVQFVQPFVK